MSWWIWPALALGPIAAVWLALLVALRLVGRREDARALAGFIPDCVVLVSRLMRDARVPRRRKLLLAVLVGYLALPFDLIPDVIPVAGQLDDVLAVAFVLRRFLRAGGDELVREHWPGPDRSLTLVLRLAGTSPETHRPPCGEAVVACGHLASIALRRLDGDA